MHVAGSAPTGAASLSAQIFRRKFRSAEFDTVAEMVTRLVSRRLLERRRSADNARAYELFLAGDGAAMLNRVMPRDASIEAAILRQLPARSARLFMKYLRIIVRTP